MQSNQLPERACTFNSQAPLYVHHSFQFFFSLVYPVFLIHFPTDHYANVLKFPHLPKFPSGKSIFLIVICFFLRVYLTQIPIWCHKFQFFNFFFLTFYNFKIIMFVSLSQLKEKWPSSYFLKIIDYINTITKEFTFI